MKGFIRVPDALVTDQEVWLNVDHIVAVGEAPPSRSGSVILLSRPDASTHTSETVAEVMAKIRKVANLEVNT